MMQHKIILRLSAAMLAFAVLIRLAGTGTLAPFVNALRSEEALSFLIYTQTGRIIRPAAQQSPPEPTNSTFPTQITQQSPPTEDRADAVISFSPEDAQLVSVQSYCDYDPELSGLLTAPLELELTGAAPTVLIIHTHGSESYTGDYEPVEDYRSLDPEQNMIAIGDEVARVLELGGVQVLHDRNIYDYPDYNGAYIAARTAIKEYLAAYPSIRMVLDLHRDAAQVGSAQLVTAATVGGQDSAQLMLVIGTDAGGNHHPNWEENLALALKLNVVLEQENPGISRPISLRSQRFNMDLTAGSLLVEVGAAGNTLEEALIAANALAEGILILANGSQ